MSQIAQDSSVVRRRQPHAAGGRSLGNLLLKLVLIAGVLGLAGCPVAYILWPRWPDQVALDAPTLPITVGRLPLNVPPAAIRVALQRRAGAQDRIDLVFLWPSLAPPDPTVKLTPADVLSVTDRVFVTIAAADSTPPPLQRFKTIYPRYTADSASAGPDGLLMQSFRNDTPYQGEDLLYEQAAPERFLVRCTRKSGPAPGMCLHEERIANADITVRFPRDWLADWKTVASGIDRLIAGLRPSNSK
jgi:hypothetical protein